jgi:ADP-heptose:LPS heptosyltransferase
MQLVEMFPDYIFVELGMNSILRNGSNCITCLCGKLTLTDIAHIIKKSFLFIGIDSSMAHFANAFDIPTVVLLGKYHNFDKYIPYSGVSGKSNFLIISYPDIVANIPVSLVYENLIKLLA